MRVQLKDTELYFDRVGQGRPMLVMHGGLGLDHTYFRPWLDKLGDVAELIYYDHRANGHSARPATLEGISHETWAADADALRAHLGFDRILLLGHSYGGFLAQEYALRFSDHLAGLILCSTAPALDYMPTIQANAAARGTPDALAALGEAFGRPMTDDHDFRSIWMRLLPMYFRQYDPQIGQVTDQATSYSAAAWNHVNANCLPKFNTLPRLKEITVPTLVLGGVDDWIMPAEQSERIQAELPNAEVTIFEESGHFPFIEEPDRFVKTVRSWIAKLD